MGDLMMNFWKRYIEADMIKRQKIVEKLVKNKGFDDLIKIENKKKGVHIVATILNGYFEDLAYVAGHLMAKEKQKEIKRLNKMLDNSTRMIKRIERLIDDDGKAG
ncbi:MAG: hypothetical protein PVI03_06695 [Candidatus Thorarchaeota archaeon]|jgi:hypothetical protein